MEEQKNMEDWRASISEPAETLKIADKEVATFVFQDEGRLNVHPDFGASIAFKVLRENETEPKIWFVKANNFTLLGSIKTLGKLVGMKVRVGRSGSKRSDTRYSITKID